MRLTRDRYDSLFAIYSEWDRRDGRWVRRPRPLDWDHLKAQAIAESDLDPRAVSPVGAQGLYQIMPATWHEWANKIQPGVELSPWNPEHSTLVAASYMEWLLNRFDWNIRKALAAYNWGIGNVQRTIAKYGDGWEARLPAETREYIAKILA